MPTNKANHLITNFDIAAQNFAFRGSAGPENYDDVTQEYIKYRKILAGHISALETENAELKAKLEAGK